jgi:hypothetical protein
MSSPEVSVVLVHHRGPQNLLEALEGLQAAGRTGLSAETILVDNASASPLEEIRRRHPSVRCVVSERNVGFAAGCRLGADSASAPVLLFVNDDAVVAPEAPRLLVDALVRSDPDVVAVAGRLTDWSGERNDFSDGFLTFDGHAFQQEVGRPLSALPQALPGEERLFACGALMAVRRDAFLASPFDEDYFAYLEDVDFGWRHWIWGRRIVAEPRALARHRGGATGEALGIFARGFLFEKNAFATAYKNFDREHFRDLMPAVLAAFLARISEMLATRNPGARELAADPYALPRARSRWRRLFGISETTSSRVVLGDPLTLAHLRALLWIHAHHDRLAAKRRAVQAARRRSDREIFARFPLRLVPTYPGDDRFDSPYFREFLSAAPPLVHSTLREILGEGA